MTNLLSDIVYALKDSFALHEARVVGEGILRVHIAPISGQMADQVGRPPEVRRRKRRIRKCKTASGAKFWMITEADRSSTCILPP
jgi:hypothetical protein